MKFKYFGDSGWQPDPQPLDDRGQQFGDGLFETIRLDGQGNAPLWQMHIERLAQGLKALRFSDGAVAMISEAITAIEHPEAVTGCKLLVTRGAGPRGYGFSPDLMPLISVRYFNAPDFSDAPYIAGLSDVSLSTQPLLAGHKHLNRLEQVLARDGFHPQWDEAVMLNSDGLIVEGCMSNVFVKLDGRWLTPEITSSGINGVVRRWLLDTNPEINIRNIGLPELSSAQGLVFTNSLVGIRSCHRFDAQVVDLAPEAKRWQLAYQEMFENA